MSIFNEEQIKAMFSREYICHECGHLMEFEDEWEDTLVCPHCGHSIDLDDYGREGNEEYENLYPTFICQCTANFTFAIILCMIAALYLR